MSVAKNPRFNYANPHFEFLDTSPKAQYDKKRVFGMTRQVSMVRKEPNMAKFRACARVFKQRKSLYQQAQRQECD